MYLEKWKDTALGSDSGLDFIHLIQAIPDKIITLNVLFQYCDLQQYLDDPTQLKPTQPNMLQIKNTDFNQYLHYEDAIIALAVMLIENQSCGYVDLRKADAEKMVVFKLTPQQLLSIDQALTHIYKFPDQFIIFEMWGEVERQETFTDIAEILTTFQQYLPQSVK